MTTALSGQQQRNFIHARVMLLLTALMLWATGRIFAEEKANVEDLLDRAKAAHASGKRNEAVTLATQAITADPKNYRGYSLRARLYEVNRQPTNAITDYDAVLKLEPAMAEAWQQRGEAHFKLGHIKESLADFDKFLELVPQQKPHHWQRGIALYYAGRFADGHKQFELHQTVNPNDVENAVWHFLCVARESGVEKARAALIPIKGDARVPMMEVHALFAGKIKPEGVLKAAGDGKPSTAQRKQPLFYAHLYLGLYFEAKGDETKAREHVAKAANDYANDDYMGDVARVHLQLRKKEKSSPADIKRN